MGCKLRGWSVVWSRTAVRPSQESSADRTNGRSALLAADTAGMPTGRVFSAFRSRDYALFWTGSFVSNVGTWMQSVALGWLVYEMTGAASWLGTVSFAANAPALFVGLVG